MIKTKRDSLEQFIRIQMEGPGACNNRFGYRSEEDSKMSPIEVINTTPGSLYSTAILFPKRKSQPLNRKVYEEERFENTEEINFDGSNDDDQNLPSEREENNSMLSQSEEDDLFSLSQRFPNSIGISCCFDCQESLGNNKSLSIIISGRYYSKIIKQERENIYVKIEDHFDEFNSFYTKHENDLKPYFILINNTILSAKDLTIQFFEIKKTILEINTDLAKEIATSNDGNIDEEYRRIGEHYRYLKSYKERLFSRLKSIKNKGLDYLSENEKQSIIDRIVKIELNETFLSYLEDILSIYNAKGFGFWKSQSFSTEIDLTGLNLNIQSYKEIFSPKKYSNLKDIIIFKIDEKIHAKLSVWLQITKDCRDSENKKRYIKIQLENTSTEFEEDNKHYFSIVTEKVNERSFFGVGIKISSEHLCPYRQSSKCNDINDDADRLNYLYRSIDDYGTGHFCSVNWGFDNNVRYVKSEFIPAYETPDVEPIPRNKHNWIEENEQIVPKPLLLDSKALEFKWLSVFSNATDNEITDKLYKFIDAYGDWISSLENESSNIFSKYNVDNCRKDYLRMRSNIEFLLERNPSNIRSFRLMNAAMFIQLWHSKKDNRNSILMTELQIDFYKNASDFIFPNSGHATWRPFQIAFILLNLDGIFQRSDDLNWEKRNELVDLVWFPTGGGKTEAYLGIIALTIINRRRTEPFGCGGTTAIMRYTLRLLATQQFQRALRVIMALDQIRQWNSSELGEEAISIGLFVGDSSLPNHAVGLLSECNKWQNIQNNKRLESKIPLDRCPWCGELLEFNNKGSLSTPNIEFRCKNIKCSFSDRLPVVLCDDYIYFTPPTLLFGTVDKFAAIAHNISTKKPEEDSRRIFGNGDIGYLTPDLIIQDELHLLLGPLGSAVSLFEAAIDQLCTREKQLPDGKVIKVRPKIISSTATTRNTELQIRALYDRDVNIFPKNGIDYDDSFFAFYKRIQLNGEVEYVAKRKYMGILPTGRTQMTTQMRLAAVMFVHRALFEKEHINQLNDPLFIKAADFYFSIISYFNSLKEVGKTDAQFYSEFTKYARRLYKRVLRYSNMLECFYAYDSSYNKSELTGRLSGSEVVDQLELVGKSWSPIMRLPHKENISDKEWRKGITPPDFILATNMISVGLDVDRFNSIIMNSMPRNIAEYIQASSRVARNDYGLVVTLHNPFRSRDLSHFEKFREFHEKMYFYVEPISITPFSKKSVEKYLPLYLAAIIRHSYPDIADKQAAGQLENVLSDQIKLDLEVYFKERLKRTQKLDESMKDLLNDDLEQYIQNFISRAVDEWLSLTSSQNDGSYKLIYSGAEYSNKHKKKGVRSQNLFTSLDAYEDGQNKSLWNVPQSLRTVEAEAVIKIKENY